MKFIKKLIIKGLNFYSVFSYLFVLILVSILVGVGFCNAGLVESYARNTESSATTSWKEYDAGTGTCYTRTASTTVYYSLDNGNTQTTMSQHELYCFTGIVNIKSASSTVNIYSYDIDLTKPTCPTCPTCPSQYTSLECQSEYSLIPVSSVTENYCTSNFDLISPSDCPISSGTGDTQRSALFLNNVQYAGASNIYVNISDLLDYSTTYIDSGSSFVLDVDGYVADTEYLDNILTIQQYHPDSEDFTSAFVGGLTLLLPYVVVILFVVFIWKLIKKVFKS